MGWVDSWHRRDACMEAWNGLRDDRAVTDGDLAPSRAAGAPLRPECAIRPDPGSHFGLD
jgi:hypothetical protein